MFIPAKVYNKITYNRDRTRNFAHQPPMCQGFLNLFCVHDLKTSFADLIM